MFNTQKNKQKKKIPIFSGLYVIIMM